ncbi:MAG: bacteriohemerythrin, partial [Candidatus Sericytochromatia bacterium]
FLDDYVIDHFMTEEKEMELNKYPFLDHQNYQHNNFIISLKKLKNEIITSKFNKTYLMFRIQIFLVDWIVNHTIKEDGHYRKYIKNKTI